MRTALNLSRDQLVEGCTHVLLGQFFRNSAWRKNVTGVLGMPEVVPFWNMEKAAAI